MKKFNTRASKGRGSVFQRDGRWVGVVELERDAVTGKRRRKWVYGDSHIAVTRAMNDARSGDARRSRNGDGNQRLATYLDGWLVDVVRPKLRASTAASYAQVIYHHIIPHIGGMRVSDLTTSGIQGFYSRLRSNGTGQRTLAKVHAVLHRALASAVASGLLPLNPAALDRDSPSYKAPEREPLTAAQSAQLLRAAHGDRFEALYVLALTTGARQGELLALRWSDADLDGAMLSIRRALHDANATGAIAIGPPKTNASRRRFAISSLAVGSLERHRETERTAGRGRESDLIFTSTNGEPVRRQNFLRRDFYPLLERAELPRIHFHDLRHSAASMLAASGTPVVVVAALLGHVDPAITLRTYQHAFEGAAGDASRRLGDALADALRKK